MTGTHSVTKTMTSLKRLSAALAVLLVAGGIFIAGSLARLPESRAADTLPPDREQVERAIEIIQYARYSHVYWWERLGDEPELAENVGDREFQARWIAYYDYVLETLYGTLGTAYYGYNYGNIRSSATSTPTSGE